MSSEIILVVAIVAMAAVTVAAILKRGSASGAQPTIASIDPEILLAPVREQIAAVTSRLEKLVTETATARTDISNKIATVLEESRAVFDQGTALRDTTTRISTALQGTGQRGAWGEVQLRRVVELAGLTEHVTFKEQVSVPHEETKLQPDLVVYLPDNRTIIVDSKAPNLHLEDEGPVSAKDLKKHITALAGKRYPKFVPGSMEFVVLFVPSEGVLASAMTEDPDISEFAFRNNVLLATPMTLLGLLRAVQYGWQQVAQIENVALIHKESSELCDRVLIMLEHLSGVQSGLAAAVSSYNAAVASVNTRLLPQVRKLGELGVTIEKSTENRLEAPTDLASAPEVKPT